MRVASSGGRRSSQAATRPCQERRPSTWSDVGWPSPGGCARRARRRPACRTGRRHLETGRCGRALAARPAARFRGPARRRVADGEASRSVPGVELQGFRSAAGTDGRPVFCWTERCNGRAAARGRVRRERSSTRGFGSTSGSSGDQGRSPRSVVNSVSSVGGGTLSAPSKRRGPGSGDDGDGVRRPRSDPRHVPRKRYCVEFPWERR